MNAATNSTVDNYLASLPTEKRAALAKVLQTLRKNMPKGFEESMGTSGIVYQIPLTDYPDTYNKQPLCYVALAAQKNYCSLYLMSAYGHKPHLDELKAGFKQAGKKLDMGKSCIRFKSADDLELPVIARLVKSITPRKWIEIYEMSRVR
jgi:hypothetical protein